MQLMIAAALLVTPEEISNSYLHAKFTPYWNVIPDSALSALTEERKINFSLRECVRR